MNVQFVIFAFTLIYLGDKLLKCYILQLSSEERLKLLKEKPRTPSVDNIWKWADAFVIKDYLMSILTYIDPNPRYRRPSLRTFSNLSTPLQ